MINLHALLIQILSATLFAKVLKLLQILNLSIVHLKDVFQFNLIYWLYSVWGGHSHFTNWQY